MENDEIKKLEKKIHTFLTIFEKIKLENQELKIKYDELEKKFTEKTEKINSANLKLQNLIDKLDTKNLDLFS